MHSISHPAGDVRCVQNSVRLVAGGELPAAPELSSSSMGRVEVCVGGEYAPISSVGFGSSEAASVCKQLGFQANGKHLSGSVTSEGSLVKIACDGGQ